MGKNVQEEILKELAQLSTKITTNDKIKMLRRKEYNELIKANKEMLESILLQVKPNEPSMYVNHLWSHAYRGTLTALFQKYQVSPDDDVSMIGIGKPVADEYDHIIKRFEELSHQWDRNEIAKNAIKSGLLGKITGDLLDGPNI